MPASLDPKHMSLFEGCNLALKTRALTRFEGESTKDTQTYTEAQRITGHSFSFHSDL